MITVKGFSRKMPAPSKAKRHTVNPKLPKNITQYVDGAQTYLQLNIQRKKRVLKVSFRKSPGVLAMLLARRDAFIKRMSAEVSKPVTVKSHKKNQPTKYKKS